MNSFEPLNLPRTMRRHAPHGMMLGVVLMLSACAYSPGLYIEPAREGVSKTDPWSISTRRQPAVNEDESVNSDGRLISITANLVKQQAAARPKYISPEIEKLFGEPQPYTLGPGDILNVVVWGHPELVMEPAGAAVTATGSGDGSTASNVGNGIAINSEGLIQFPFVGVLKLTGLTELQARDLLTQKIAKYIKDPQVTLRIQAYRSQRIYVEGEVRTPGLQSLSDLPMTLPEAVGRAGGLTSTADRSNVAVTRNGNTTMVNLADMAAKGISPTRLLLKHGDLVRVLSREDSKVFVLGEVLKPATQFMRNGRLTLNEALSDAGGINPISANPSQIFVVRAANSESPQIYHLDSNSAAAFALAESFELQARDVVYVDPVPLVRWNRVISLILPSAQAISATRNALN